MEHFVAYHSAKLMGHELKPSGELRFLSRKPGLLKKAVGNTVWVVQGVPDGKKTSFFLCGAYVADRVDVEDPSSNLYVISGQSLKEFVPPVPLDSLDWFRLLYNSQRNFSLGFNRINDEKVVQALEALQAQGNPSSTFVPPDVDLPSTGTEGVSRLVSHLRRERNRAIVEAKKVATLNAKGRLCCEVCGFDFAATYGALGEGFCEVHHLVPLSAASDSVTTTLNDLAILCSNCHRIIHRSDPMLSVSQLAEVVRNGRR
ncbi:putative HNH restriction endonuclease [Tibeticola sediminis]|uniref:Putative HNH restriction endonuclease n=1 Tax=Tibeticola sediminis TaxID=1917811 RepID=A0A3N4VAC1_9BURK|nr:HNH endonuclease [Tibeticola sediminis]RPE70770.1 putative HNH restriction endonuclease [Tibeticola sediminis]